MCIKSNGALAGGIYARNELNTLSDAFNSGISFFVVVSFTGLVPESSNEMAEEARRRNGHCQAETRGAGRRRRGRLQRSDGQRCGEYRSGTPSSGPAKAMPHGRRDASIVHGLMWRNWTPTELNLHHQLIVVGRPGCAVWTQGRERDPDTLFTA